ncbi:hypothetical protein [Plebeiibacterium sediminum]|uniref:Uncharacterized protein n=1 Tax=Plebeiibacterium sediminum TaxID=2992112 RepID=A0AAE3SDP7_9BACT|nr:hypothetical protein [Plebeiobacterium sediminum]MCW3785251.1 hypothetical protein [Plebeiobacterium sediminum]
MKINYNFLPEENLLFYHIQDEVSIEKWRSFYYFLMQKEEWNTIDKVLIDLRSSKNILSLIDCIQELVLFRKTVIKKKYNIVFLVDHPEVTVFAALYSKRLCGKKTCYYCSTVELALKYFKINIEMTKFNETVKLLEQVF